jgi:hypothetical protein
MAIHGYLLIKFILVNQHYVNRHLHGKKGERKTKNMNYLIDKQNANFKLSPNAKTQKRVVTLIKNYPTPKEIFQLITHKEHNYSPSYQPEYPVRDRAIMAFYFASAGRGSEVVEGPAFSRDIEPKKNEDGDLLCVVCGKKLSGNQRKFCSREHRREVHSMTPNRLMKGHPGLLAENISVTSDRILVSEMEVVKRSKRVREKYGAQAVQRPPYAIPLKMNLFENNFWNQLVPFGWLIKEYLEQYAPEEGKLFNIGVKQAYLIVREVTGNYLNWFRAQGKQFYGAFIFDRNAVELAEFVNDQDWNSERPYTRYDWSRQLKDKSLIMDFDWIESAVEEIKGRIKK